MQHEPGHLLGLVTALYLLFRVAVSVAGVLLVLYGWHRGHDGALIAGAILSGCSLIAGEVGSGRPRREGQ
jgi:hypothetical protein